MIVGADHGIGAALVDVYEARGDKTIAVYLGDGSSWSIRRVRVIDHIDATDEDAVARLAADLGAAWIDILVHVA